MITAVRAWHGTLPNPHRQSVMDARRRSRTGGGRQCSNGGDPAAIGNPCRPWTKCMADSAVHATGRAGRLPPSPYRQTPRAAAEQREPGDGPGNTSRSVPSNGSSRLAGESAGQEPRPHQRLRGLVQDAEALIARTRHRARANPEARK